MSDYDIFLTIYTVFWLILILSATGVIDKIYDELFRV